MHDNNPAAGFYGRVLKILSKSNVPFAVGGGFAVFEYTKFTRPTNDLDIFCKGGDIPKIVAFLKKAEISISITDERWLAKASEAENYVDIIFSSPNYLVTVDDVWFEKSREAKLFGCKVKLVPKEELI